MQYHFPSCNAPSNFPFLVSFSFVSRFPSLSSSGDIGNKFFLPRKENISQQSEKHFGSTSYVACVSLFSDMYPAREIYSSSNVLRLVQA